MQRQKIALISVYNKEGITEFAKELVNLGWKIISSGGTSKHLKDAGLEVTDVEEITGMPAILSHRVVTLHPKIHGGLLALDTPEHLAELEKYEIPWIDMICDDLYPLEEEIQKENATRESVREKTDIGGPAFIRSAAKGKRIVICEITDREKVIDWLKKGEPDRENFLNTLAAKAEMVVARYCALSGEYHSGGKYKGIFGEKKLDCAYGENAYQKPASLYKVSKGTFDTGSEDKLSIDNWELLAGSSLSYNNICDVDRMIQTMMHIGASFEKNFNFVPNTAIGAKHGNACGAGVAEVGLRQNGLSPTSAEIAVEKMLQGDLRAIFGGCVMLNFPVDEKIAEELINKFSPEGVRRLLDIVAAPSFTPEAIEILSRKKGKCRLLANPAIEKTDLNSLDKAERFRYVRGGFLTQPNYTFVPEFSKDAGGVERIRDIVLAWAIGCTSNSNTITLVKDGMLLGNGVGQQDRVGAANLAISRAGDKDLTGATAYSDSFFPFPDAPEVLIEHGIKNIFSTSGSVNDEKIIELCRQKGVNLIMLPDSEARGFYQH